MGTAIYRVDLEPANANQWQAIRGGEIIATGKSVEFAACRVFHDLGITGFIETWHRGAAYPSMRIKIDAGAKLSVSETEVHGPRLTAWRPFDPDMRLPVNPSTVEAD